MIVKYLILMLLEVYIYVFLVSNKSNRKFMLLVSLFLSIIPFYYIGAGLDFVNRVSIPLLIILLVYVIKYLNIRNNYKLNKNLFRTSFLIIFLLISSITGINEINRSIENTYHNYINGTSNITDGWKSYSKIDGNENIGYVSNFVSPRKDNFYFKYIVR